MPLLLLDSRAQNLEEPPMSLKEARERLYAIEKDLRSGTDPRGGQMNFYHASNWPFLHSVIERVQSKAGSSGGSDKEGRKICDILSKHRESEAR